MNLTEFRQHELGNMTTSANDRILAQCHAAAEFIDCAQFEESREALGELWRGLGIRPPVDEGEPAIWAEALLQCGALTSGIGSARNIPGAQEKAKDLISESQRLFESIGLLVDAANAQSVLSVCYWRMGAFDEARVVLDNAARMIGERDDDVKARIFIRRALVETWACRYHDAWNILREAEPFLVKLSNPLKGRWHTQMGIVLRQIGIAENRLDYLDRAIIEYTAAIYHYELSENERYVANILNNLAMILHRVGRYKDAHENLDRAVEILTKLKDAGTLAMVNETRARVLLAENRFDEAKTVIEKAVEDFEVGGEQSCLTDALTIQATVMARLGDYENSLSVFQRAIEIGANAGALENAGHASLSLIEEHGTDRLSELDVFAAYKRADEFLKGTQDAEDISRLRTCAKIVMRRLMGTQLSDKNFRLKKAMRDFEGRFIEAALSRTGGKISQAATMLGLSHQTLSNILKYRQRDLQDKRLPPTPRRRSIVRNTSRSKQAKTRSVLFIEDDKVLARAVKQTLEREGFSIDIKSTGVAGLNCLKREKKYDVLIFDNEQQGINGISLARKARELQHRRSTPIIVFSSDDVSNDAYRAGVNLFLQKPDAIQKLTANIKRLLSD